MTGSLWTKLETTVQCLEPEPTAAYVNLSHSAPQRRLLGKFAPDHLRLTHRLYDFADPRHAAAVARLSDCCRTPALYQDMDTGEFIVSQKSCKHRLCPKCSATKSTRLADEARQLVEKMDAPKFVTLTIVSNDQPLEDSWILGIERCGATRATPCNMMRRNHARKNRTQWQRKRNRQ